MEIAGIELRYLVDKISKETDGYYVSNIYGIDRDSLLFKLHHPDKPDILLVLSTMGLWITSVRVQQVDENRLVRRLRSDLLRLKLSGVKQPGLERLAYLRFSGFDREFVLVGEFFGGGNIILCNDKMKVLALQHAIDVRHRGIKVGLDYVPPPIFSYMLEMLEFVHVLSLAAAQSDFICRTTLRDVVGVVVCVSLKTTRVDISVLV